MPECGDITYSTECADEHIEFTLTNNNVDEPTDVVLDIPEGTEFYDPEGNLIYTHTGGVDKTKIRVPPGRIE